MGAMFRVIALLALVGLAALIGVNVYNAGVTAGLADAANHAVASGAPVVVYPGAYVGHPWGFGFGFFGFFFVIFGFFLFFGLLRAAFGWSRYGGHHYRKYDGGRGNGWRSHMDDWHSQAHGEAPKSGEPPKADQTS